MKLGTKNLKPNSIIPYCFLCFVCCGLASSTSAASSKQAAGTGVPVVLSAETSQDVNALDVTIRAGSPPRRLWQSRIAVPASEQGQKHIDELQRLIEQVRSVKFKSKDQTSEPAVDVKPRPAAEDNKTSSARKTSVEPVEKWAQPRATDLLPYEPVSQQTLQMLESLSQHPEQAGALRQAGSRSLSELADILFLSGHPKQAAVFYQQALDRTAADDAASAPVDSAQAEAASENRAWILFQLGNCLRAASGGDPPTAVKMYRQLIAEYPNSPWTDLAKAREQLIVWYLKDSPLTLIGTPLRGNPQ